jgi:hypothetical protein
MAGTPNPEAIAWYVRRSEELLDDLRDQTKAPIHFEGDITSV